MGTSNSTLQQPQDDDTTTPSTTSRDVDDMEQHLTTEVQPMDDNAQQPQIQPSIPTLNTDSFSLMFGGPSISASHFIDGPTLFMIPRVRCC